MMSWHAGAGLTQVEGRRQSTRVKMAPLRWYCNEHVNYERTHKSAPPLLSSLRLIVTYNIPALQWWQSARRATRMST
jgi:hypothetical protein